MTIHILNSHTFFPIKGRVRKMRFTTIGNLSIKKADFKESTIALTHPLIE
jgi:hypothetical protein